MGSRVRISTLEEQIRDACRINIIEHRRAARRQSYWSGILPRDPALWIEMACITLIIAVLIPVLIASIALLFFVLIGVVHVAMAIVAASPWAILLIAVLMMSDRTESVGR